LDTLGDKWSLVVIRDLVAGKRRFSEFLGSPEGIKRNILTERLKRLERAGLISRRPYQDNPTRFEYRLTARGADLLPVLQAMARWARRHIPGVWTPSERFLALTPEAIYPPAE
jgi:DNA-binding HxlR family transcriptional regulator